MAYKWTDGWLCREQRGTVVFFPMVQSEVYTEHGYWYRGITDLTYRSWGFEDWIGQYNLKPPAKGKKVYVSIQL